MSDGNGLAQGLVGGLLLARAENTPKAGMRAGLLMGLAGGFNPIGAVLAQSAIRTQEAEDAQQTRDNTKALPSAKKNGASGRSSEIQSLQTTLAALPSQIAAELATAIAPLGAKIDTLLAQSSGSTAGAAPPPTMPVKK